MQNIKDNQRNLFYARVATSAVFFSVGAIFANWISRIPQVKENLNLTEATLGLALMVSSIGLILGLLITSGLIARFGSRTVSIVATIAGAVTLALIGFAFNFWSLAFVLFFAGMFNGIGDMAMNAQGAEVEKRMGKQIMNSFHAFWSIGTFTGALMGAGFITLGFGVREHFLVVPIVFIVLMVLARGYLLDIDNEKNVENQSTFQFPPRAVWGLGLLALAAGLSEGALLDWGGLYLFDIVGTSEAVSTFGLATFTGSMVVGRLAGDWATEQLGASRLVRLSGFVIVLGVSLALAVPILWVTLTGYVLAGLGMATTIPLAFSAAGKMPEIPSGRAISGVATIAYAAFIGGPPIIGFIAEATSLRFGLAIVIAMGCVMVFMAGQLDIRKQPGL